MAVAHAQRREDVALDVLGVRLAGGSLDDEPGEDEVAVGVLERRPGGAAGLVSRELPQRLERGAVGRAPHDGPARGLRQPGGLLKDLTDRDAVGCPLVGQPELRHVAACGCVELESAGVDELHRRQRGEGLRGRPEHERRLRRHAAPTAGLAETAGVHDSPPGHHGDREARHARAPIPSSMTRSIRASVAPSGGAAAAGDTTAATRASAATDAIRSAGSLPFAIVFPRTGWRWST